MSQRDVSTTSGGSGAICEIKYVEIPTVEYKDVYVPKKQVIEVEKRVPKIEVVEVEKVVDVPQIEWTDKVIEVPQVTTVEKRIPRREVVEVPVEVVTRVPKVQVVTREEIKEIPGEIIEVPKPFTVENRVPVEVYTDRQVQTVVAQVVKPVIKHTNPNNPALISEIDACDYEPVLIPIKVFIPKPVCLQPVMVGKRDDIHRNVDIPPAQYNALLKNLNRNISEQAIQPLLRKDPLSGLVPMLPATAIPSQLPAGILPSGNRQEMSSIIMTTRGGAINGTAAEKKSTPNASTVTPRLGTTRLSEPPSYVSPQTYAAKQEMMPPAIVVTPTSTVTTAVNTHRYSKTSRQAPLASAAIIEERATTTMPVSQYAHHHDTKRVSRGLAQSSGAYRPMESDELVAVYHDTRCDNTAVHSPQKMHHHDEVRGHHHTREISEVRGQHHTREHSEIKAGRRSQHARAASHHHYVVHPLYRKPGYQSNHRRYKSHHTTSPPVDLYVMEAKPSRRDISGRSSIVNIPTEIIVKQRH